MNKALKYNDGHICKRNLTDVAEFCLESPDERAEIFRGTLDVNLIVAHPAQNMVTKVKSSESKKTRYMVLNRIIPHTWISPSLLEEK